MNVFTLSYNFYTICVYAWILRLCKDFHLKSKKLFCWNGRCCKSLRDYNWFIKQRIKEAAVPNISPENSIGQKFEFDVKECQWNLFPLLTGSCTNTKTLAFFADHRVLSRVPSDRVLFRVVRKLVLCRILSDRVLLRVLSDRVLFRVLGSRVLLRALSPLFLVCLFGGGVTSYFDASFYF